MHILSLTTYRDRISAEEASTNRATWLFHVVQAGPMTSTIEYIKKQKSAAVNAPHVARPSHRNRRVL